MSTKMNFVVASEAFDAVSERRPLVRAFKAFKAVGSSIKRIIVRRRGLGLSVEVETKQQKHDRVMREIGGLLESGYLAMLAIVDTISQVALSMLSVGLLLFVFSTILHADDMVADIQNGVPLLKMVAAFGEASTSWLSPMITVLKESVYGMRIFGLMMLRVEVFDAIPYLATIGVVIALDEAIHKIIRQNLIEMAV